MWPGSAQEWVGGCESVPSDAGGWHCGSVKDQERLLVSTARSQRGVFTLAQAKACGIPRRTISGRVSRGVYETLHPGVFGLAGSEDSWHRRVLASVLSISEPASASHKTAAYLWGMTSQRPEVTEVVSLSPSRPASIHGPRVEGHTRNRHRAGGWHSRDHAGADGRRSRCFSAAAVR